MPEVSRFFGIVIRMYWNDHAPPHLHAEYGSDEIAYDFESDTVLAGSVSSRALGLVRDWVALHRDDLRANWNRARNLERILPIDPLD